MFRLVYIRNVGFLQETNWFKVVVGGILKASAGPSWRPMTRLGGERPGISTALPVRGSDWLLRLSTSCEVRMACVPPAQTESTRDLMHSGQLERLEAMFPRASERCMERALPELTLGWPPQDSVSTRYAH